MKTTQSNKGFITILTGIVSAIAIAALAIISVSVYQNYPVQTLVAIPKVQQTTPEPEKLGASNDIPTPVAFFESSLASAISSSATSMTLTSATDKAGNTLASSTYAFVIDVGTAQEEMVIADCTATACTNMTRGLSPITGTTTVASLQFAHRRGASVKITDGPQLLILSRMANGNAGFPNKISYTPGVTITSGDSDQTLASKGYVLNTANAGAATSTESRGGLVELGTLAEQASSYDGGSDKPTVLQTKNSTSTCQVVGSYNIVASSTTGKLDKGCFDQTANYTFTGTNTFATSTMASTTITNLNVTNITGAAKSADVQTFTSSGTWTKLTGAKFVQVIAVGGGAGGGSGRKDNGGTNGGGSGGGGGSVVLATFNASILGATETITVGTGGTGGAAQTVMNTNGNNGGVGNDSSFGTWIKAKGGAAGSGGQTISISGGAGGSTGVGTATTNGIAGQGANSRNNGDAYSSEWGGGGGGGAHVTNVGYAGGSSLFAAGGGGGGAGDNGTGSYDGGAGGTVQSYTAGGGGTAGTGSGDGGNGSSNTTLAKGYGGAGGGGGSSNGSGNAGAGGNGGLYGGGGGGGGGSDAGNSGAGGNGADGVVVVVTFF